jgi:arsenate reductase
VPVELFPRLSRYLDDRNTEAGEIQEERRRILAEVAAWIRSRLEDGGPTRLNFICTHNSRRSHMAQLWAQASAAYHGVVGIETYSGGTEATAFNPRAVAALQRAGFEIDGEPDPTNPLYLVRYSPREPALRAFSKVYDQAPNPAADFGAFMTCSDADENCPVVFGASARFSITYQDPKEADDTPREAEVYDERCRQVAREIALVFAEVAESG